MSEFDGKCEWPAGCSGKGNVYAHDLKGDPIWLCDDHTFLMEAEVKRKKERLNDRARKRREHKEQQGGLFTNDSAVTQGESMTTWKERERMSSD